MKITFSETWHCFLKKTFTDASKDLTLSFFYNNTEDSYFRS